MRARILKYFVVALFVLVAVSLITPALKSRSWSTYEIVETLDQPIRVDSWDKDGLQLSDGRHVSLPGLLQLPNTSEAITQAIQRGVEIDGQSNIYGLVRIHHWCGNDSCRNHIARVNLAHMLMFLQQGVLARPLPQSLTADIPAAGSNSFSEWGWNVSDYFSFQTWSRMAIEQGF
jgi:hypothetical protein